MPTVELDIRQLADEGGTAPLAPITVTDAVLDEDGNTLTDTLSEIKSGLIKYVDVQVTCNAAAWQTLNLPNGISSDRVINVTRRSGTGFYGCLWWKNDLSSLRFLRINTSGTNLVLIDTAGDVTVRVFYY